MFSRLLSPFQFQHPKPTGRALQLRIDAAKLYSILQKSKHSRVPSSLTTPPSSEEEAPIASDLGLPSLPPFSHQTAIIKYHLFASTRQILLETRATLTSPGTASLRNAFSFIPSIATSSIKDAGRGLYVDGTAEPGTVLALYPGISYLPSQLRYATRNSGSNLDTSNTNDDDNDENDVTLADEASTTISDYAIARYDGVVIDGATEIAITLEDCLPEDASPEGAAPTFEHPFANAHLVNHPPPEKNANALQFLLDVDIKSMTPDLAALMPVRPSDISIGRLEGFENRTMRQRVPGTECLVTNAPPDRVLRTVALVALRTLKDEEIFMDYRFNPKISPPEWYSACGDGSQAVRRWYPRSAFTMS